MCRQAIGRDTETHEHSCRYERSFRYAFRSFARAPSASTAATTRIREKESRSRDGGESVGENDLSFHHLWRLTVMTWRVKSSGEIFLLSLLPALASRACPLLPHVERRNPSSLPSCPSVSSGLAEETTSSAVPAFQRHPDLVRDHDFPKSSQTRDDISFHS